MSKTTHAVIGTGTAPEKVISEGLNDIIEEGDNVVLVWDGRPSDGLEVVYDYVLDEGIEFTMFYEDGKTPARAFREADNGVIQKSRNPLKSAVQATEGKGRILFLWDSDKDDDQIDPVFDYKADGDIVLELTNGLTPISDQIEVPEPVDPDISDPEAEADSDDTRFTKEELENMAAPAVKRYGTRLGTKAATKGGIIAELFPEGEVEEPLLKELDLALEALIAEEEALLEPEIKVPGVKPVMTGVDEEKFMRSLTNVTPSPEAIKSIEALREAAKHYGAALFALAPASRERSLALTELETSVMWAVKSIALA